MDVVRKSTCKIKIKLLDNKKDWKFLQARLVTESSALNWIKQLIFLVIFFSFFISLMLSCSKCNRIKHSCTLWLKHWGNQLIFVQDQLAWFSLLVCERWVFTVANWIYYSIWLDLQKMAGGKVIWSDFYWIIFTTKTPVTQNHSAEKSDTFCTNK